MLVKLHWTLQVLVAKSKDKYLETNASAYLFEDRYRICFSNSKQKYYFEIPASDISEATLKIEAEAYFAANRNELDVCKCIRCGKWGVPEGCFCVRCVDAVLKNKDCQSSALVYFDIET